MAAKFWASILNEPCLNLRRSIGYPDELLQEFPSFSPEHATISYLN
jgi:hypothetical protein